MKYKSVFSDTQMFYNEIISNPDRKSIRKETRGKIYEKKDNVRNFKDDEGR